MLRYGIAKNDMSFLCIGPLTVWSIFEIIHIWTAVVDESEEWSSQLIFQFKQLERRSLKKKKLWLQREINYDDHSSLSSTTAVQIWIFSYILHTISLLTGDMNSIKWPRSQCVALYIAQLAEHRTGIAKVMSSNPVEALIFFSGFFFPVA